MDENKVTPENHTNDEPAPIESVSTSENTPPEKTKTEDAIIPPSPEIESPKDIPPTDLVPPQEEKKTTKPTIQGSTPSKEAPVYAFRWDYHTQFREDAAAIAKEKKKGRAAYASIFVAVTFVTVLLLIGVLLLGNIFPAANARGNDVLSDVYAECIPSYVAISVMTPKGEGAGSGIVLTSDGYISTNYHVVEDATEITVIMSDDTEYEATYLDGDELNDIAVLKIDAHGLKPAKLGSSANSRVGDKVMAIGTPHSINYRGTMTSGYISALDRRFVEQNENGTVSRVLSLIQTDTSVNPGNSGGPLFNMNGEVIGVVSLKISGNDYEGLGFAIPIESVIDIIDDVIENGKITNPNGGMAYEGAALGITGFAVVKDTKYLLSGDYHYTVIKNKTTGEEEVIIPTVFGDIYVPLNDKEQLAEYEIEDYTFMEAKESGVYVIGTTKGFDSAEKLKPEDIILTADGISCAKMTSLQSLIANKRIGDTIKMEVFRDGQTITVDVELGRAATME